jgi:transposase
MLQSCIPFLPKSVLIINAHVALYRHDGEIVFYTASGPIFSCAENDRFGFRMAQGIIIKETTVTPAQLAKALGINRSTVYRNSNAYSLGGASALIINKGNREAYKLKREKLEKVQTLLNQGCSISTAAKKSEVSIGCIRYALEKGTIKRKRSIHASAEKTSASTSASQRSAEDSMCLLGIGAKREAERLLASQGKLDEAAPAFYANESVRYAGVLLALPALANLGLFKAGIAVYGKL